MQLSGEHTTVQLSLCTAETRYNLNSAIDGGDWSALRPGRLAPVKAPAAHRLGG
jgi:hypothetical protein